MKRNNTAAASARSAASHSKGIRRLLGLDGGAKNEMAVVRVAVQDAGMIGVLVKSAPFETQFTGEPRVAEPFENWTVPVGPTSELLVVEITAVSVTMPPEATLAGAAVTVVVVVACVIVTESEFEVFEEVKLLLASAAYVAVMVCGPTGSCTGWSSIKPRLFKRATFVAP